MSSQSAPHRTATRPTGLPPVKPAPELPQNNSERVSWLWLPAILAGAYILFAYVVPFSAELLARLLH